MKTKRSTKEKLIDEASIRLLDAIIRRAHRLPYEERIEWFANKAEKVIAPLAGYRRRTLENLEMVFPDRSRADKREIASKSLRNFGRTLIEFYSPEDFKNHIRAGGASLEGDGVQELHNARKSGRPVLMVAGHFGNYLASACMVSDFGYPVAGLYRPFTNPLFDSKYRSTLLQHLSFVFPQGKRGTFAFNKHLLGGDLCAIFSDVNEPEGELINFLGVPAPTAVSAARLALRTNALVLPFFDIRQEDGISFRSVIEAPIAHDDPVSMTQAITDRLEARVLENPDQWFWVHRRWKRGSV